MLAPPRPTAYPAINDTPCTQEALVKPTPLPPSGTSQRAAPWVGEGVEIIHAPCEHARRDTVMPASLLALLYPSGPGPTMPSGHVAAAVPVGGFNRCMLLHGHNIQPYSPGSASLYAALL
jgi:hypothetical protein